MIEVEIKVRISDPDLIKKKFEEHQGFYKLFLLHEDTYYNMPKGLRDFKKTDEALRLRTSIRFDSNNKYHGTKSCREEVKRIGRKIPTNHRTCK